MGDRPPVQWVVRKFCHVTVISKAFSLFCLEVVSICTYSSKCRLSNIKDSKTSISQKAHQHCNTRTIVVLDNIIPITCNVHVPQNKYYTWWRHQMKTFFAWLAPCAGNSAVTGEFPVQRPGTRSFDVSFDLRLNKQLSSESWGWWFETQSRSWWRHRNVDHRLTCGGRSLDLASS